MVTTLGQMEQQRIKPIMYGPVYSFAQPAATPQAPAQSPMPQATPSPFPAGFDYSQLSATPIHFGGTPRMTSNSNALIKTNAGQDFAPVFRILDEKQPIEARKAPTLIKVINRSDELQPGAPGDVPQLWYEVKMQTADGEKKVGTIRSPHLTTDDTVRLIQGKKPGDDPNAPVPFAATVQTKFNSHTYIVLPGGYLKVGNMEVDLRDSDVTHPSLETKPSGRVWKEYKEPPKSNGVTPNILILTGGVGSRIQPLTLPGTFNVGKPALPVESYKIHINKTGKPEERMLSITGKMLIHAYRHGFNNVILHTVNQEDSVVKGIQEAAFRIQADPNLMPVQVRKVGNQDVIEPKGPPLSIIKLSDPTASGSAGGFYKLLHQAMYDPSMDKDNPAMIAGQPVAKLNAALYRDAKGELRPVYNTSDKQITKAEVNKAAQLKQPLLVVQGDALSNVDLTSLVQYHAKSKALFTLGVQQVPIEQISQFGVVVMPKEFAGQSGPIDFFTEKPKHGTDIHAKLVQEGQNFVNTGFYVVEPKAYPLIKLAYEQKLAADRKEEELFEKWYKDKSSRPADGKYKGKPLEEINLLKYQEVNQRKHEVFEFDFANDIFKPINEWVRLYFSPDANDQAKLDPKAREILERVLPRDDAGRPQNPMHAYLFQGDYTYWSDIGNPQAYVSGLKDIKSNLLSPELKRVEHDIFNPRVPNPKSHVAKGHPEELVVTAGGWEKMRKDLRAYGALEAQGNVLVMKKYSNGSNGDVH